jgi:hypothetical protein
MSDAPLLDAAQIHRLLLQQSISDQHPWVTNDSRTIEGHFKHVCAAIVRATGAKSRIAWSHYGSGYASFVDAWFYKATSEFNPRQPVEDGEGYTGLVVLLSRLSPYFVFMEEEQSWTARGGARYLPQFDMLDRLRSQGVIELARQVQPVLESHGLIRALRTGLSTPLPDGMRVPTVLTDRGFTQFDALFHWED